MQHKPHATAFLSRKQVEDSMNIFLTLMFKVQLQCPVIYFVAEHKLTCRHGLIPYCLLQLPSQQLLQSVFEQNGCKIEQQSSGTQQDTKSDFSSCAFLVCFLVITLLECSLTYNSGKKEFPTTIEVRHNFYTKKNRWIPTVTYFHPTGHRKPGRGLEYNSIHLTIQSERLYISFTCEWKPNPDLINTKSFARGK